MWSYRDLVAAFTRPRSLTWFDQASAACESNSQCEKLQLPACLDSSVCCWTWQAVDERSLQLCDCVCVILWVCVRGKKRMLECVSDRQRGCLWVCETKERVHEVTSRQLFDFPSFPGKQFQEQYRRKNHQPLQLKCHMKKKNIPSLFVGDWIIAIAGD